MEAADAEDRAKREAVQQQAFSAFDLEGNGHISAIDLSPALSACESFESVEVSADDMNWAMRRHGVQRGGVMSLMQFNGICEALYKRKVEPKIRKQREFDRLREEAEREEAEHARRVAMQRRQRVLAQQYRTEQDAVARAFYAFDTDDSGEVSGVDLSRLLAMSGVKDVPDAKLQAALQNLRKGKGSLFTLSEFRSLHAQLSGGDGFGGKRGAGARAAAAQQQQQQVPPPAAPQQPVSALQQPVSGASSGERRQAQQPLPLDLPPPASAGSVLSTPGVAEIEVHPRQRSSVRFMPSQQQSQPLPPQPMQIPMPAPTPMPQQMASASQQGGPSAMPTPASAPGHHHHHHHHHHTPQHSVCFSGVDHPHAVYPASASRSAPTPSEQESHPETDGMTVGSSCGLDATVAGLPQQQQQQQAQPIPMPAPTQGAVAACAQQAEGQGVPYGAAGQLRLPEGVEAALKHHPRQFISAGSRRSRQQPSRADTPAGPASATSATSAAPSSPAAAPATPSDAPQKAPLRKVRVIGDEDRLRGMVEGHPHIAGWTPVHASHVAAYAVVLRDVPKKDAVGIRFPDGEVAWYPSQCVVEFGDQQQQQQHPFAPPPPSAHEPGGGVGWSDVQNVGPADVPLAKLFADLPSGGRCAGGVGEDPSWPSSTSANSVFAKDHQLMQNVPHPFSLQHHLQHVGQHNVVGVDEFGDDIPGAAPGGAQPELPPSDTDATSLPPSRQHSRYGPPPRGAYMMPKIPKYDITELDTIYPLGKKKLEVNEAEVEQVFQLFDLDGEGEVGRQELPTLLRSLGYAVPVREVEALLAKAGRSSSGSMTLHEFTLHVREVGRLHKRNRRQCDLTKFGSTHSRTAADSLRNLFFLFHDGGDHDTLSRDQLAVCLNAVGLEDSHEVDIFLEVDRVFGNPNVSREDVRVNLETFQRLIKQMHAKRFTKKVAQTLQGNPHAASRHGSPAISHASRNT